MEMAEQIFIPFLGFFFYSLSNRTVYELTCEICVCKNVKTFTRKTFLTHLYSLAWCLMEFLYVFLCIIT